MTEPLWTPDDTRRRATNLWAFASAVGRPLDRFSYGDLHSWSVEHSAAFWREVFDWAGGVGDLGERDGGGDVGPDTAFFPDASLNLAENYLRRRGGDPALIYRGEDVVERQLSWDEVARVLGSQPGRG